MPWAAGQAARGTGPSRGEAGQGIILGRNAGEIRILRAGLIETMRFPGETHAYFPFRAADLRSSELSLAIDAANLYAVVLGKGFVVS